MTLASKLSSILDNAVDAIESIPDEWNAKINQLRNAITTFESLYAKLQSQSAIAKTDPVLYADYTALMTRGAYVKSVITDTLSKLGSALGYAKNVVGMSGMGNLGALPLIPIAVIAGALALITKWTSDALIASKKLDQLSTAYNDAKARGASTQELSAIAHDAAMSNSGSDMFGGASSLANKVLVIMIAGGLFYLLLPTLKKQLNSRGKK